MTRQLLAAATALAVVFAASAEGYQINTLSARQNGMGHTGTALKLGAESMFFNPAGLAFSDKTLDLSGSVTGLMSYVTCTHDGAEYKTKNDVATPLSLNASFRIYDNLQAGVSLYTPYGSGINWTDNWPGSILNERVSLKTFTVQPTFSWRVTPRLSVGAGLMVTWGSVDLDKALVSGSSFDAAMAAMGMTGLPSLGNAAAASVNLKGNASVAFGGNFGVMYDIDDRWTAGVNFRTRMLMKVKAGKATVDYASSSAQTVLESTLGLLNQSDFAAAMPLPWVLNMGVSYKPTRRLTLAFDAQLTGWHTYRSLDIIFPSHLQAFDQHIDKNYSDAWCFHFGAQYALTHRFDIRAGLMVDTSPVSDSHYNPETPGMTKIEPSAGLSFRPVDRLSIDLSLLYVAGLGADGVKCSYDDLLLKRPMEFKADYRLHAFAPAIGISYSF